MQNETFNYIYFSLPFGMFVFILALGILKKTIFKMFIFLETH